jgi:ubiquinone/menaquinone biosynthesis C-methylase UbiE
MSVASEGRRSGSAWLDLLETLRCPGCSGTLGEGEASLRCAACRQEYPIRDGILIVGDRTSNNNQVAQEFYDSALWPKFRFWEKVTWLCNGGERRARGQVLRHLPQGRGLRILDVAIGDGVYLPWLPADWHLIGIDVSWSQLAACRSRAAARGAALIQGEAETLPFHEGRFDAVLSIGAFNYFNDPEAALREMVRVSRPGGMIVISDELPNLTERMLGHKLGAPAVDRWIVSRVMHLGDRFTDMVERLRGLDVIAIARRVIPDMEYHEIWRGLGYVLVGRAPASRPRP